MKLVRLLVMSSLPFTFTACAVTVANKADNPVPVSVESMSSQGRPYQISIHGDFLSSSTRLEPIPDNENSNIAIIPSGKQFRMDFYTCYKQSPRTERTELVFFRINSRNDDSSQSGTADIEVKFGKGYSYSMPFMYSFASEHTTIYVPYNDLSDIGDRIFLMGVRPQESKNESVYVRCTIVGRLFDMQ